jgi:hypothetical protein
LSPIASIAGLTGRAVSSSWLSGTVWPTAPADQIATPTAARAATGVVRPAGRRCLTEALRLEGDRQAVVLPRDLRLPDELEHRFTLYLEFIDVCRQAGSRDREYQGQVRQTASRGAIHLIVLSMAGKPRWLSVLGRSNDGPSSSNLKLT